jgi:hypothetical protein
MINWYNKSLLHYSLLIWLFIPITSTLFSQIPNWDVKKKEKVFESNPEENSDEMDEDFNPYSNQFYYGQSAFNIPKGMLFVSSQNFVTAHMEYGITDNFSAGISSTLLFTPIALNAKYSEQILDNHRIAFSGNYGSFTYILPGIKIGTAFSIYTYGNTQSHISFALGYGTVSELGNSAIIQGGFKRLLYNNVSIAGEFWHIRNLNLTFAGPYVSLNYNRFNWNMGAALIYLSGDYIVIPAFGFTVKTP